MSLWSRLVQSFPQRSQHPAGLAAPTQLQPLQPANRPKTLSELEREIEAQAAQATPLYTRPVQRPRRVGHKLGWNGSVSRPSNRDTVVGELAIRADPPSDRSYCANLTAAQLHEHGSQLSAGDRPR